MKQLVRAGLILAAAACLYGSPAVGCSVPPPPFNPDGKVFASVVVVRVLNDHPASHSGRLHTEVLKVLSGRFPVRTYDLYWHVSDGRGSCPPTSPYLRKGQRARVYFKAVEPFVAAQIVDQPKGLNMVPAGWKPID